MQMHHRARGAARLIQGRMQRHFLGRGIAGDEPAWVSTRDSRAGSSEPSEALVGVTSQPPSSSFTLILPDEPGVSPRSNSETAEAADFLADPWFGHGSIPFAALVSCFGSAAKP